MSHGSHPNCAAMTSMAFWTMCSTVPFQPECTAATMCRRASYSSIGTQSAVRTPMATPGKAVIKASYPSNSSRVVPGRSMMAILQSCTWCPWITG